MLRYRVQEGLLDYRKDTNFLYNARLALAADRQDEALNSIISHLRQQKSLEPGKNDRLSFWTFISKVQEAVDKIAN